jgi:hypothetical protein
VYDATLEADGLFFASLPVVRLINFVDIWPQFARIIISGIIKWRVVKAWLSVGYWIFQDHVRRGIIDDRHRHQGNGGKTELHCFFRFEDQLLSRVVGWEVCEVVRRCKCGCKKRCPGQHADQMGQNNEVHWARGNLTPRTFYSLQRPLDAARSWADQAL